MSNSTAHKNRNRPVNRKSYSDSFRINPNIFHSKYWDNDSETDEIFECENFADDKTLRLNKSYDLSSRINKTQLIVSQSKLLQIETFEGFFHVDSKLNLILDEINNSKKLLNLLDDWDEEGAIGCNPIVLDRAINVLLKYSQNVLKYHNVVIFAPEINLGKDGSIDLEWRSENKIFLFNVINSEKLEIEYYGNDLNSKTIIKGVLEDYSINRTLSFWMQNLS